MSDCLVIAWLIGRVLVALVRHEDEVDDFIDYWVLGQCLKGCYGIGRAVESGNAYRHALVLGRLLGAVRQHLRAGGVGGAPGGVGKRGVLLGGDIEPQPAAVFEVFEWQLELMVAGAYQVVGHGNALAILLGAVEGNICLALNVQAEDNGAQLGPAAPIGGREGVEVGFKRGFLAGRDGYGRAVKPAEAFAVLLGLDEVEHPHIKGLAALRQQNALQGLMGLGVVGSHDNFDSPNGINSSQRFSVVAFA